MVNSSGLTVIWSKRAVQNLRKAFEFIRENSEAQAIKVRDGIIQVVDDLAKNPEKFPLAKFKMNNPGNYRAFEKFSYRIAYQHTKNEIRILRVRHIKQEPKNY